MINQKGFANIIVIVVVIAIVAVGGYFVFVKKSEPVAQQPTPSPVSPMPTPTTVQCTDYSIVKVNDEQSFIYTYKNDSELRAISEKKFEGILREYNKLPYVG